MNRKRAREMGLRPGVYDPGALNAITDVAGVAVGHVTLVEGIDVSRGRRPFCLMAAIFSRIGSPLAWRWVMDLAS